MARHRKEAIARSSDPARKPSKIQPARSLGHKPVPSRATPRLSKPPSSTQVAKLKAIGKHRNKTKKRFRLLDLPRELRDMILSLALGHDRVEDTLRDGRKVERLGRGCLPSLLQTNHQLRHEAAELFFSRNTFVLTSERRFDRLRDLLDISQSRWNGFVKTVILVPTKHKWGQLNVSSSLRTHTKQHIFGKWAQKCRKRSMLRHGVVWIASRQMERRGRDVFGCEYPNVVVGDDGIAEKVFAW